MDGFVELKRENEELKDGTYLRNLTEKCLKQAGQIAQMKLLIADLLNNTVFCELCPYSIDEDATPRQRELAEKKCNEGKCGIFILEKYGIDDFYGKEIK